MLLSSSRDKGCKLKPLSSSLCSRSRRWLTFGFRFFCNELISWSSWSKSATEIFWHLTCCLLTDVFVISNVWISNTTDILGIQVNITLEWMPEHLIDSKSTSVQVMAWCFPQQANGMVLSATSHYLNRCWTRSLMPYGITLVIWSQWVNIKLKAKSPLIQYQTSYTDNIKPIWKTFFSIQHIMKRQPHYSSKLWHNFPLTHWPLRVATAGKKISFSISNGSGTAWC